ncbi:MAG: tRNA (adenosine(37)-N6)-threonylcarbamoyltransferase complex ATPase subunit type 1 TsaE [Anaplasma sp.]
MMGWKWEQRYRGLGLGALGGVARAFSRALGRDMVVSVSGDLGAGKTAFCKEVISALSGADFLGSPTFSIIHEYECSGFLLYHVDLYRVSSVGEALEVGIFDVLVGNLVLVEWPEVLADTMKFDVKLGITHAVDGGNTRDLTIVWNKQQLQAQKGVGYAAAEK